MEALGLRQSLVAADLDSRLAVSSATNAASEFKITEILGQGSFGAVYQASHIASGLDVALKVISFAGSSRRQMQQEIANLHRVRHLPGVPAIFGCVVCPDKVFIAMELVQGHTLQALMDMVPNCVMSLPALRRLVQQLASTLRGMHERGGTAAAKLIDFGLSIEHWELAESGTSNGTPQRFGGRQEQRASSTMEPVQQAAGSASRWTTLRGREVVQSVLKLAAPLNTGRESVEVEMSENNGLIQGRWMVAGHKGAKNANYRWNNISRFLRASKNRALASSKLQSIHSASASTDDSPGSALAQVPQPLQHKKDLKLATASAGPTVYCSPTPLHASWYVGKQRMGLAALCSLAYVDIGSSEMNKLLSEGRVTVASQLQKAMRQHSV